jgi:hypothetical protein
MPAWQGAYLQRVAAEAVAQQLDQHHQRPQTLQPLRLKTARACTGGPGPCCAVVALRRARAGRPAGGAAGARAELAPKLLQQQRDRLALQQRDHALTTAAAAAAAAARRRARSCRAATGCASGGRRVLRPVPCEVVGNGGGERCAAGEGKERGGL